MGKSCRMKPELKREHLPHHVRLAGWIGRVGPCGLSPVAPGTVGTLAAALAFYAVGPQQPWIHLCIVLALFSVGSWACHIVEKHRGTHDLQELCIDEVVGFWITAMWFPHTWLTIISAFAMFRIFDIWKPFPIRWLDRHVKGGIGVMIDDVAAGAIAAGVLFMASSLLAH